MGDNNILKQQIIYSGTDGIISISSLISGMIGAGIDPYIIILTGSIASFSDALSMAISEYNSREELDTTVVTFASFYAFALLVLMGAFLPKCFYVPWVIFIILILSMMKKLFSEDSNVLKTMVVSILGGYASFSFGKLMRLIPKN